MPKVNNRLFFFCHISLQPYVSDGPVKRLPTRLLYWSVYFWASAFSLRKKNVLKKSIAWGEGQPLSASATLLTCNLCLSLFSCIMSCLCAHTNMHIMFYWGFIKRMAWIFSPNWHLPQRCALPKHDSWLTVVIICQLFFTQNERFLHELPVMYACIYYESEKESFLKGFHTI